VTRGQQGALGIRLPLPPGCAPTLWNADERFREAYLSTLPDFYDTSDAGHVDEQGFVWVMGRTDDIINVAGHRLSTGAMEEVLAAHPDVAECAVIGIADAVRGQAPLGLVVLKSGAARDADELARELVALMRERIGPVAAFREVRVVARLPKTRSGKILRATLRKLADGEPYAIPPTIDDPAALDEIAGCCRHDPLRSPTRRRDAPGAGPPGGPQRALGRDAGGLARRARRRRGRALRGDRRRRSRLLRRPRPARAFRARADADHGRAFFARTMALCGEVMQAVVHHPAPVIAAVEGIATAAGCQIVASCDLAVASPGAKFCTPGVEIGLFCSTPAVRLARALPRKQAMEMLLTGRMVGAEEALRLGLVNGIADDRPRRRADARRRHRRALGGHDPARQGRLPGAGGLAAGRGLCGGQPGDGGEHAGRRCLRGDRRLPGQTRAALGGRRRAPKERRLMRDDLPRRSANHQPLTPLLFLERSAATFPTLSGGDPRRHPPQLPRMARPLRAPRPCAGPAWLQRGEVVAALLPNTPAMLEAHYGVRWPAAC
jgi:enoyl-CoA hydratase/carnithine racemase